MCFWFSIIPPRITFYIPAGNLPQLSLGTTGLDFGLGFTFRFKVSVLGFVLGLGLWFDFKV